MKLFKDLQELEIEINTQKELLKKMPNQKAYKDRFKYYNRLCKLRVDYIKLGGK